MPTAITYDFDETELKKFIRNLIEQKYEGLVVREIEFSTDLEIVKDVRCRITCEESE